MQKLVILALIIFLAVVAYFFLHYFYGRPTPSELNSKLCTNLLSQNGFEVEESKMIRYSNPNFVPKFGNSSSYRMAYNESFTKNGVANIRYVTFVFDNEALSYCSVTEYSDSTDLTFSTNSYNHYTCKNSEVYSKLNENSYYTALLLQVIDRDRNIIIRSMDVVNKQLVSSDTVKDFVGTVLKVRECG